MPKVLDTDYSNHLWATVLDELQKKLKVHLDIFNIYVSPNYQEQGNLAIRIWPTSLQASDVRGTDQWSRVNNLDVVIYQKANNPGDAFYQQYFNDFENVYQFLFDFSNHPVALGGTFNWIDGTVGNVLFDELEENELEVDNLHSVKLEFSCITIRNT